MRKVENISHAIDIIKIHNNFTIFSRQYCHVVKKKKMIADFSKSMCEVVD